MTPKEEIELRINHLQERLRGAEIDAALFMQAVDVFYFSGSRQNSVLWVPQEGHPILLVRKSLSRAHEESRIPDVRPFPLSRDLPSYFGRQKKIGMTFDVLPTQHYFFYKNLLHDTEIIDISSMNREIRSVKSEWELEQMRISGRMLAETFKSIPEYLKPGMRELDLAAEFEYRMRKSGIGGNLRIRGFNQEITGLAVAGPSAAFAGCFDGPVSGKGCWTAAPYGPSNEIIKEGFPVMVDYGGSYNGYIVDMTRIFAFRRLSPELEKAFEISLNIQNWLEANMKSGAVCEDLFSAAAEISDSSGLGERFMGYPGEQSKFVGHGVGLELDELPVLAQKFKAALNKGNTLAIEPKFVFPGLGVVGIENTYAITETGCERLTVLPDDVFYL